MRRAAFLFAAMAAFVTIIASIAIASHEGDCAFAKGNTTCETETVVPLPAEQVGEEPASRTANNPGGQPGGGNWSEGGTTPILQDFQRTDTTTTVYNGKSETVDSSNTVEGEAEPVGEPYPGETQWSGEIRNPGGKTTGAPTK